MTHYVSTLQLHAMFWVNDPTCLIFTCHLNFVIETINRFFVVVVFSSTINEVTRDSQVFSLSLVNARQVTLAVHFYQKPLLFVIKYFGMLFFSLFLFLKVGFKVSDFALSHLDTSLIVMKGHPLKSCIPYQSIGLCPVSSLQLEDICSLCRLFMLQF